MNLSTRTKELLHNATKGERIFASIIVIIGIVLASIYSIEGVDERQLVRALEIELSGGSAYSPEMDELFHELYVGRTVSAGFGYPLPAMWLALPIVILPDVLHDHVWTMLTIVMILISLRLHRVPLTFILFLPWLEGITHRQVTPILVSMTLIGIWALENKRWWLTGVMVALTIAAKPQTTLLLSSVLAVLAIRRGGGMQVVTCGAIVALATFALEPTWIQQWFVALVRFQGAIQREIYWQLALFAILLWKQGYRWGAAAVIQYTLLFTGTSWYGAAVLALVYTQLRESRMLWIIILSSWVLYPVRLFVRDVYELPEWIILGIPYFLPLAYYALREPNPQLTSQDESLSIQ